jgi:hypothetical protein
MFDIVQLIGKLSMAAQHIVEHSPILSGLTE